jgi:uncharacterized protein (DUF1697 family)
VPKAKRQIALLRGINVGRHKRVAMPALRKLLASLGYDDVRTHLQSGNVILDTSKTPARLQKELEQAIAGQFGVEVDVIVRTRDELARVVARDPLGDVADNPSRYLVSFLSAKPEAKRVRELEGLAAASERFVVVGRELYAWQPSGVHASKLSKALADGKLGVTATARNWSTVTKLLALADAES